MNHTSKCVRRAFIALSAVAVGLSLSGCAELASDEAQPIVITGSSTIYPFARKVAQITRAAHENIAPLALTSTGSTEGIATFCEGQGPGTVDIVNASRRMTLAEFETCRASGVADIIEVTIGRDGIVFASALEKGFAFNLTPANVYRALAANPFGEEQTRAAWHDVDDALPKEPILVYGPAPSSGTRDALMDVIMRPVCTANPAMATLETRDPEAFDAACHSLRADAAYIDQGEKDDLIVGKIANNPRAIGVFGYSYLEENADTIKALTLDGVAPSAKSIADGTYPGSRPLYMYIKKAHIGVTPGLKRYLDAWPEAWKAGGELSEIGLVPATRETQMGSARAIADQTTLSAADFE
ncbi:MAG: substrate-binding domain-containing protein [Pseudomonadota bacterium]